MCLHAILSGIVKVNYFLFPLLINHAMQLIRITKHPDVIVRSLTFKKYRKFPALYISLYTINHIDHYILTGITYVKNYFATNVQVKNTIK